MASQSHQGMRRVLEKLREAINTRNFYEAHQIYRTLYFRYLAKKDYKDLLDLLYNGSRLLLAHHQYASGADLGILCIDVLLKSDTPTTPLMLERIASMFSLMRAGSPERETFLHDALRWSMKKTNFKWGHPDLHNRIAQVFWKEKNYASARLHFLYSKDGKGCAMLLAEIHQERGYSYEIDLFIAQAVLQYLCLQNKTAAQEVFDTYIDLHPKIDSGPPYLLPLLNFISYLLQTIEDGRPTTFKTLCDQYQLSLSRDPSYRTYLEKIGQLFFNMARPRPRNPGLFGSLLQSFLNGFDEENSDDETRPQHHSAPSTSQAMQDLD